jgi:hypothetical protein
MPCAHFTVHMSAYRDEDRKLAAFVACVKITTSFTHRMEFHNYPFKSITVYTMSNTFMTCLVTFYQHSHSKETHTLTCRKGGIGLQCTDTIISLSIKY